jgi:hypothetical protein
MSVVNDEYIQAVARSSAYNSPLCHALHEILSLTDFLAMFCAEELHAQITDVLRLMLAETSTDLAI